MTDDRMDEKFEEMLRMHAADYNEPPRETPRDEMWARIQAAREAGQTGQKGQAIRVRWLVPLAAAATLAVGIGIGRLTMTDESGPTGTTVAAEPGNGDEASAIEATAQLAYKLAATEHLSRVEAFLTLFRTDARAGRSPEVRPARALLINTRLMLQSPAAEDPAIRTLLSDLELLLAQIALYDGGAGQELQYITEGIERQDVLLKLRSATSEGREPTILQGA